MWQNSNNRLEVRSCDLNDSDCSDHVTKEQDDIKGHDTYQWNENHKKKTAECRFENWQTLFYKCKKQYK